MEKTRSPRAALAVSLAILILASSTASAQAPNGSYECWYFSSPRGGLNFKLTGDRYVDSEGNAGTVRSAGTNVVFQGAGLDGIKAQYKGGNPPSFSILGPRGDEVSVCQLAR